MVSKLEVLADSFGVEIDEMLEDAACDSIVPGVCMNAGCDYTTDVEPDQDGGWCEECGTRTVKSCLLLAGII